jgi:release factor glutamine methyltransferase
VSTGNVSIGRLARRACFSLAYRFYARAKLERTDQTQVMGYSLLVPPGVFHPALFFSSKTLGEYLGRIRLEGKALLDMGCGSGILSLIAAGRGASVTAIDINPRAVEATRDNAARTHLRLRVLCGNLFEPLDAAAQFDLIVFNPPFYTGDPEDTPAMAWHGGADYRVVRDFFSGAPRHMREGSSVIFILSSDMGIPRISEIVHAEGFTMECAHSRAYFFEQFSIYEARRRS